MKMPALTGRDRRALVLLVLCAALFSAVYFWPQNGTASVVGTAFTPEQMEQRILKLRRMAAAAPGRQEALKKAQDHLGRIEQGMLHAGSVSQAQAQMLEIVRRVAGAQPETFALRGTEFGAPRPLGSAYGEVVMTVLVDCPVEQLITFLVDLSNQNGLIAVSEIQVGQAAGNRKILPLRLTLTAVVPRSLVPEKKGGQAF